jgi:hypothetical protein
VAKSPGRPRKQASEKKSLTIKLLVTPRQDKALRAAAARAELGVSTWAVSELMRLVKADED